MTKATDLQEKLSQVGTISTQMHYLFTQLTMIYDIYSSFKWQSTNNKPSLQNLKGHFQSNGLIQLPVDWLLR